ncbi:MFS transporter [Streptomyces sp. ODS28]|uniref:MFS transporter n=1 Tax=Streptomyces sp. ODS28 TaxID=3136688 RepID=UPI0031E4FE93
MTHGGTHNNANNATYEGGSAGGRPGVVFLGLLLLSATTASAGVATVLPALTARLALDGPAGAWLMAVYATGFAVATPLFGRAVDLYGLRAAMVSGLLLMVAGSLTCLFASPLAVLLAGRAVQGAGGGAVPVVAGAALLARADRRAQRRGLGGFTALMTLTSTTVPVLAGLSAQLAGPRALFVVSSVLALALLPASRGIPSQARGAPAPFGLAAAAGVIAVVSGLLLGVRAATDPRASAGWIPPLAGALLLAGGAVVRGTRRAIVPVRLLRERRVAVVVAAGFALFGTYFALQLAIPALLAAARGWSPAHIGLVLLPVGVCGALGSWAAGRRDGHRSPAPLLAAVGAAGTASLACAAVWPGVPWVPVAAFGVISACIGAGNVVLLGALALAVGDRAHGSALGLYNLVFYMGGSLTAAVTGRLLPLSPGLTLAALAVLPVTTLLLAALWGHHDTTETPRAPAPESRAGRRAG